MRGAILGTGGVHVNISLDRWSRLALVAAMMAALGLGACGRKGPLDAPSAGLTTPEPSVARPSLGAEGDGLASPGERPRAAPVSATASPPPKKDFFLDFLLAK